MARIPAQRLFATLQQQEAAIGEALGARAAEFARRFEQHRQAFLAARSKADMEAAADAMLAGCLDYPEVMALLDRATAADGETEARGAAGPAPRGAPPATADAPGGPPAPPGRPGTSTEQRLAAFKEVITGVIGLIVVLMTGVVIVQALRSAGDDGRFQGAKDLLLIMNSLVGVVLGYYFGRIPADAQARRAEEQKDEAQRRLQRVAGEISAIRSDAGATRRGLEPALNLEDRLDRVLEHLRH